MTDEGLKRQRKAAEIAAHLKRHGCVVEDDNCCLWYDADAKLHRDDGPAQDWTNGSQGWWQHGQLHRVDGPAITHPSGQREWYQHGLRHRLDGPAVITFLGDEYWYQEGLLHCETGPAQLSATGNKRWYLQGAEYSKQQWIRVLGFQ
jgi:hypothetical protein